MPSIAIATPGFIIWGAIYWSLWMDTGINPIEYVTAVLR